MCARGKSASSTKTPKQNTKRCVKIANAASNLHMPQVELELVWCFYHQLNPKRW
jgi:hypothetical protein